MKQSIILFFLLTNVCSAASVTTQNLGNINSGTTFKQSHTDETFTDIYDLYIKGNSGVAAAAINVHFEGSSETTFTGASLKELATGVSRNFAINNADNANVFYAQFGALQYGAYQMEIDGIATGGTSSYTGNWAFIRDTGAPPMATPVPAAIWFFISTIGSFFGFRMWSEDRKSK
jgi:hypothetical protein